MAKKVKNPNQGSLFDIAPEPKVSKVSQVKFVPAKKEPTVYVVGRIGDEERYHQSMPLSWVDKHKEFQAEFGKERGNEYTFEVLGWDDYWEKWHSGRLTLGHH